MKARLPRRTKKAMYTTQRLLDKKMGYKTKKRTFKIYMYTLYTKKLFNINFASVKSITGESIQGTYQDTKK